MHSSSIFSRAFSGVAAAAAPIHPQALRRAAGLLLLALALPLSAHAGAGKQLLHGHRSQAMAKAPLLGDVPPTQHFRLGIQLALKNTDDLHGLIKDLYNPKSPRYRKFLKPKEFYARYCPAPSERGVVADFMARNGLVEVGNREIPYMIAVDGSAADIEKIFHTRIRRYQRPDRSEFFGPDAEPSVDLDVQVVHVHGLDNFIVPKPAGAPRKSSKLVRPAGAVAKDDVIDFGGSCHSVDCMASGCSGCFTGQDLRNAYAGGVANTGAGQHIALVELDSYYPGDLDKFRAAASAPPNGLAQFNSTQVVCYSVPNCCDYGDGTLVPTVLPTPNPAGNYNFEVIGDICSAIYMAPSATIDVWYGPGWSQYILPDIANADIDQQISMSWLTGGAPYLTPAIMQFAAQGQSFFLPSGDWGPWLVYPGSDNSCGDPNGCVQDPGGNYDDLYVTFVGGSDLRMSNNGQSYASEVAMVGSGGGIMPNEPIPDYQAGLPALFPGFGSSVYRNAPDVSIACANAFIYYNDGTPSGFDGTSMSSPVYAGFMALVNEQNASLGQAPQGFLNPYIYGIGSGPNYATEMHDVVQGSSDLTGSHPANYAAVPYYDMATGWGSPNGQAFITDLISQTRMTPTVTFTPAPTSTAAVSPSPTVEVHGPMVADFEEPTTNNMTLWGGQIETSGSGNGNWILPSPWQASSAESPGNGSAYCAHLTGLAVGSGSSPTFTLALNHNGFISGFAATDITPYCPNKGLQFDYRADAASVASGTTYLVQLVEKENNFGGAYWNCAFTPSDTNWHTIVMYFPTVAGSPPYVFGGSTVSFDQTQMGAVIFAVASSSSDQSIGLSIDNVTFAAPPYVPPTNTPTPTPVPTAMPSCIVSTLGTLPLNTRVPMTNIPGWDLMTDGNGTSPVWANQPAAPGPNIGVAPGQDIRYDNASFGIPSQLVVGLIDPGDFSVRLWQADGTNSYYAVHLVQLASADGIPHSYTMTLELVTAGGPAVAQGPSVTVSSTCWACIEQDQLEIDLGATGVALQWNGAPAAFYAVTPAFAQMRLGFEGGPGTVAGGGGSTGWTVDSGGCLVSTATPSPTSTATPTVTGTSSNTATPTSTSTATPTPSFTASPTATRTPSRTASPTPTATATRTASYTASPTATRTPSRTASPTATFTATRTSSRTASPTPTSTATRTPSRTVSPTATRTPSRTASPTRTATATRTPSRTASPTRTSTATRTPSRTVSPTRTSTATRTPTRTNTATATPSFTRTATATRTPSRSPSPTATATGVAGRLVPASADAKQTPWGLRGGKSLVVAPNPAGNKATVWCYVAGPGSARLSITDLDGRVILRQDLGFVAGGALSRDLNLAPFASGLYVAVLEVDAGGGFVARDRFKLAVVK